MVPILIHLPPPSSDTEAGSRDMREVMREKTAQAEVLYNLIAGVATEGLKAKLYGQRHIALELIATHGLVHFYAAVPVTLLSVVEKAIMTAYPGARLEQVEDHNIFNQDGRLAATMGGEMVLRAESSYPVSTYREVERDPMEALLTTLSTLGKDDGAAVQIMIRPANPNWVKASTSLTGKLRKGRHSGLNFGVADLAKAAVKAPVNPHIAQPGGMVHGQMTAPMQANLSNLELSVIEAIEEKTKHPGFEVLVRVLVSSGSVARSQQVLRDLSTAFALFERPGLNGFKFLPALDVQGLVTAFIFRFFPPELHLNVLNSMELATLFHLPDSQFTPTTNVQRQQSKQVDGPVQLPTEGLLFGHNEFRGVKKEIRLSPEDRRRHTYVLGQTGTGKSTLLENLAVQDMLSGNGFAFIDPHGDTAEKLLAMVPKHRAEDIVYFNPADTEYPLGLNLFEFTDPTQKDFLIQETINMLYKLYDPGHTGIIGPRYEHWYRNAALTLMSDPNGATFIEIPKVFTDTDYLKQKFKYLKDPTVIDFWTKEMGQTSDYHKSEMLGWFVSKFGAFQNNEMMRNIIGQTKSAFNIRDIMDQKKILIVNLSKGRVGELNSQLLGMIFVIKFQAAAMSRADMPEDQRADFSLYVDEFQNFSTDSFASILSEARKYRLNLVVANQFIGQLSQEIRDAVFGNIGTIIAHRMGPEDAEFMVKQFAPAFDASDLVNLPNYNAAVRLMVGGVPSAPFTMQNLPPLGTVNAELGLAVKQLSAAKYGLVKSVAEADIMMRLSGDGPVRQIPATTAAPTGAAQPVVAASQPAVPAPAAPSMAAPVTPVTAPITPTQVTQPLPTAAVPEVPQVAVAAPVMAPPPIGAPPVELPSAASMPQATAPTAAIAAATAKSAMPALDHMASAPPPIGAKPIDLAASAPMVAPPVAGVALNTAGQPMEPAAAIIPDEATPAVPPVVAPSQPVAVNQLTITDITGGKAPRGTDDMLNVPLVPPGSAPVAAPVAAVTVAEPTPQVPYDPALDPMADVPLMDQLPPVAPAPVEKPVERPQQPAAPVLAPVTAEPVIQMPTIPTPAPVVVPEPAVEPKVEEAYIHFVDPNMEAVLGRPVEATPSEPSSMPSTDTKALESLAAVMNAPEVKPEAPVVVVAPIVATDPSANPQFTNMAATPPPIGAAPVDLPVATIAPALTPASAPVPTPAEQPEVVAATDAVPVVMEPVVAPAPMTDSLQAPVVTTPSIPASEPVVTAPEPVAASPEPVITVAAALADNSQLMAPEPMPAAPMAAEAPEEAPPVQTPIIEQKPAEVDAPKIGPESEPKQPQDAAEPAPEAVLDDTVAEEPVEANKPAEAASLEAEAAEAAPAIVTEAAPEEKKADEPELVTTPEVAMVEPVEPAKAEVAPAKSESAKVDPISKAEEAIDELLSESLIRKDNERPRLPELTEDKPKDEPKQPAPKDKPGGRRWLESAKAETEAASGDGVASSEAAPVATPAAATPHHAYGSSHKVIQPLEPIVPIHDKIMEEAQELLQKEAAAAPEVPKPDKPAEPMESDEASAAEVAEVEPVASEPETKAVAVEPVKESIETEAENSPVLEPVPIVEPEKPMPEPDLDVELPEAESLAAEDVAAKALDAARPAKKEIAVESPAAEANRPEEKADEKKADGEEETEVTAAAPKTGTLIMPTAPKPAAAPEAPTPAEKPPKLAKGEVFVDEHGNVIIGE